MMKKCGERVLCCSRTVPFGNRMFKPRSYILLFLSVKFNDPASVSSHSLSLNFRAVLQSREISVAHLGKLPGRSSFHKFPRPRACYCPPSA